MFDLDKKREDRLTFAAVFAFALIITSVIIYLNSTHNILGHSYRDVFFYLIEALRMSGADIGGYQYVNYLSPLLPFLTSLLFRLGWVSESTIFFTSGIFFLFGILGMFKLLRLRFGNFYSLFGSVLYGTLLINVKWVANGTLDIAFMAILLWALYFFILAMEKNQKYFYLAFPLAVLSFFMKYPAALIFPLMILYFMSKTNTVANIRKYFKNLSLGVVAGIVTSVPFFAYFLLNDIPLGFLNQAREVSSRTSLTATHGGELIGNDLFYYIRSMWYNISSQRIVTIIILAIALIGIILTVYLYFSRFKDSYSKIKGRKSSIYKFSISVNYFYISALFAILMVAVSFFTASLFSFFYSELLLFGGLYLFAYSLTKIILEYDGVEDISLSNSPFLVINITMAGLFLSYLVFFSAHLTKADRYFTAMAPGFIYYIVLFVDVLLAKIKGFKFRKFNLKYLIPIAVMVLMVLSIGMYLTGVADDSLAINEKHTADWISDKDGVIFSDRGPIYTWMLQKEVPYAVNVTNDTLLNQELLDNNVTYYISIEEVNLTSYTPVKEFGDVTVYTLK